MLRISNAYGPSVREHQRQGVLQAFRERVRSGEAVRIWGDGEAVRDYVHVDDVIAALGLLLERDITDDVFNVASGTGTSVRELLSRIERVTGRPVVIERTEGEYAGVRRNLLDVSKLRAHTGWSPCVELDAGIAHLWKAIAR